MRLINSQSAYGFISITLHWLTAAVVYGMFALGLWMVTLGYYDTWYHKAPDIHKGIGILLMMGLIIRVFVAVYILCTSAVEKLFKDNSPGCRFRSRVTLPGSFHYCH
nr:Cytochrome b561 homolog 2 [Raoultella sp. NCTC 9187]